MSRTICRIDGYWYVLVLRCPLRYIDCCSIWILLLKRYQILGVVPIVLRRWYAEHTLFTIQRQRENGHLMNNPVLSGKIPPLSSTPLSSGNLYQGVITCQIINKQTVQT